ncbi:MAG: serine hydrolase domain-containing protein [Candidatus Aminicenantes bacterium]|jgi:CubicO group peptidase (beta-lactamase class C family)
MKRKSLWIFFLIIVVAAVSLFLKRTLSGPKPFKDKTKVDQIFAKWDKPDSPGASLAVVKGKKVVYARGYGSASLEYDIPITPQTVFHVASVSKQFTAFAVAVLADSGKLSLDDDIRLYLPEVPDFGKTITIRHLIHHISGLRDQWELLAMAGWRLDDVITKNHILKMVRHQEDLNFNPGDEYLYCNTGFTLLAEIVARVTEKSFREWTQVNIFEPLGMTNTHFHDDHEKIVKNRAYSYSPRGKGFRKRVLSYANVGATSLFTTAEDLTKWVKNFDQKTAGGERVVELMHSQGVLNNGERISYAFGLVIGEYKGLRTVSHSGADAGFRSHVIRFPEEDFAVIVLSNLSNTNPSGLARQVAEVYLAKKLKSKKPKEKKEERKEVKLETKILKAYEGLFQIRPDYVLNFEIKDNHLTYQATGGRRYILYAESETRFFRRNNDVQILFYINNIGQVTGITLEDNGQELSGKRIQPVTLSPEQLSEYAGEYYSRELDTFYRIVIEDGRLVAAHQRHDDIPLTVITPDHFSGTQWFFRRLHFTRNGENAVLGFLLTGGRVRNLKFLKNR